MNFRRLQTQAWLAAVGGAIVCLLGLLFDRTQFFRSYWFAWIFWAGVAFGGVPLAALHFLTGGRWGDVARPPIEAAMTTLPAFALLFLPAAAGLGSIFSWTDRQTLERFPHKAAYLTEPGFLLRAAVYFAAMLVLVFFLRAFSRAKALRPNPLDDSIRTGLGGFGAVAYVLCMNFASTDWVMSLEPQWSSTIFAVIFMASQFLSTLALAVATVCALSGSPRMGPLLTPLTLRDLGNLLLAFVIFWTYVSFSQFLIIWSGNLPREIDWYLHRRAGHWPLVAVVLAALQFATPFALLLLRASKHQPRRLGPIAALVFAGSALNVFWLIAPSFHPQGLTVHWLDLAAFVAIGGIFTALYCRKLEAAYA